LNYKFIAISKSLDPTEEGTINQGTDQEKTVKGDFKCFVSNYIKQLANGAGLNMNSNICKSDCLGSAQAAKN